MPWQNNNDGGKDRGPWGSGPGGGGQEPPDIDELIRKGQDKFRSAFGGGRGGKGGGKGMFMMIILMFTVGYLYSAFYKVQPDEAGVVLRFGKWIETKGTGLHFHFPPIDQVIIPKVTAVNKIDVGFGGGKKERQMLTGDENIVDVQYSILWRIKDPARFLFNLEQREQSIKAVSESAMREVVARTAIQQIMTYVALCRPCSTAMKPVSRSLRSRWIRYLRLHKFPKHLMMYRRPKLIGIKPSMKPKSIRIKSFPQPVVRRKE